jgi:hypothetical protein
MVSTPRGWKPSSRGQQRKGRLKPMKDPFYDQDSSSNARTFFYYVLQEIRN